MSRSWIAPLCGAGLLMLASMALSPVDAAVARNEATAAASAGAEPGSAPANAAYASEVPERDVIDNKDGTALAADQDNDTIPVAEELDFVRDNTFRKTFEQSLKTVANVKYYGTRYVGCEQYPLEIHTARPDQLATLVKTAGSSTFEASKSNKGVVLRGEPQGLTADDERALLETFNFDTPIADLEKGHPLVKPLGMQKLPGTLTWKLQEERTGGHYRILYVDSHTGDVVKFSIMNAGGTRILEVKQHDYRNVDGIRVAFAIDYLSPDGALLASDRIERVEVARTRS